MREKEKSTSIIYVRHGNTDFPEDRIYCDDIEDPVLNDKGLFQVKATASYMKGEELDAVYVSPSKRTIQTAEEILKGAKAPSWVLMDKLKERHFGILEGLYFDEIEQKYSEEYRCWKEDPINFRPEGGESVSDLLKRVKEGVSEVLLKHAGKRVMIVAHVGSIRMAVADAIGIPVGSYRCIGIDNASFSRIDYGKTQNNIIFLNRVAYESGL